MYHPEYLLSLRPCANHTTVTDSNTRANNRSSANPAIITDHNRFRKLHTFPEFCIKRVTRRIDLNPGPAKHITAYFNRHPVKHYAVDVEIHVFSAEDIVAVITKERGFYIQALRRIGN